MHLSLLMCCQDACVCMGQGEKFTGLMIVTAVPLTSPLFRALDMMIDNLAKLQLSDNCGSKSGPSYSKLIMKLLANVTLKFPS